jgi:hypothetical protein
MRQSKWQNRQCSELAAGLVENWLKADPSLLSAQAFPVGWKIRVPLVLRSDQRLEGIGRAVADVIGYEYLRYFARGEDLALK